MKKKTVSFLMAAAVMTSCIFVNAETYDFTNMTTEELKEVKDRIDEEITLNHSTNSDQENKVQSAAKTFVEEKYGKENVDWAWIDYTYTKDWDFYTMSTHADITKNDGGRAQYDVYCELIASGDNYQVVYCTIGTEEILNQRSTMISDQRVLKMLGAEGESQQVGTSGTSENQEADPSSQANTVLAQRGDSSDIVKEIQEMLIHLQYMSGPADGTFGEGTENAIKTYQTNNGLNPDGIVTQAVYDSIKYSYDNVPVPEEVISISAVDLYNAFDNNEIAAEAAYKGKTVQVSGTIGSISTDILGDVYVALNADEYGWTSVQCYFSDENKDILASLGTGQSVTIKGTCDSMSIINVIVNECSLVG